MSQTPGKCSQCSEAIPDKCPSDDFCSSSCQQTWMESQADWPTWAYSWNGVNRKGEKTTAVGPTYWHPGWSA